MLEKHIVYGPNTGGGGDSSPIVGTRLDIDPFTGILFDASYLHNGKTKNPTKPRTSLPTHFDIDPYSGMLIDVGYLYK